MVAPLIQTLKIRDRILYVFAQIFAFRDLFLRVLVLGVLLQTVLIPVLPLSMASTGPCFNFNTLVQLPLRPPPDKKDPSQTRITDSGKLPGKDEGIWGLALGEIPLPIQEIYQLLLDHSTIKDPEKVNIRAYPEEEEGYTDFHRLRISVSALILKVKWEEEWAYRITEGTANQPKKVVISYQKTTGTNYIPHLCGSIVLTAKGPQLTEVYLYEEVNALGKRSPEDTVKGHLGTLETLIKRGRPG